jgi:septal ring factor EnvC (AmiA/AmiB activator)
MKKTQIICGIIVALISITGALFAVDQRYAKSGDVKLVSIRLELKILQDRLNEVNDRIWKLEDRYRGQTAPPEVRDEIRQLRKEKEKLERQIEILMRQQTS